MLEVRDLAVGYGKVAVLRDARLDVGSGRIVRPFRNPGAVIFMNLLNLPVKDGKSRFTMLIPGYCEDDKQD